MATPDEKIRQKIETMMSAAGWSVQMFSESNQASVSGCAIRAFPLARGYGSMDYLLFIEGKAMGVIEVKNETDRLCGILVRSEKYSRGLPFSLRLYTRPLPFLYQMNGREICFTNAFDPEPLPRILHGLHRPETLRSWLEDGAVGETPRDMAAAYFPEYRRRGRTFHERVLINMPDLVTAGVSSVALKAVQTLEDGLKLNKRRILMTLDRGPERLTMMHLFINRLLRFVDARRILILLDQKSDINALRNIFKEDVSEDAGQLFPKSFYVQTLSAFPPEENRIAPNARICLSTFGMLDQQWEEKGRVSLPIETFEVIVLDECSTPVLNNHRQLLEYFDAYIIGLSKAPEQASLDFFSQNISDINQESNGLNVLS